MTGVLKKEEKTQTHREKNNTGRWRQRLELRSCEPRNAKDCQQTIEAKKNAWNRFFPRSFRENMVQQHLDFGLLASRIRR